MRTHVLHLRHPQRLEISSATRNHLGQTGFLEPGPHRAKLAMANAVFPPGSLDTAAHPTGSPIRVGRITISQDTGGLGSGGQDPSALQGLSMRNEP